MGAAESGSLGVERSMMGRRECEWWRRKKSLCTKVSAQCGAVGPFWLFPIMPRPFQSISDKNLDNALFKMLVIEIAPTGQAVVAQTFSCSTWEAEAGRSLGLEPAWSVY